MWRQNTLQRRDCPVAFCQLHGPTRAGREVMAEAAKVETMIGTAEPSFAEVFEAFFCEDLLLLSQPQSSPDSKRHKRKICPRTEPARQPTGGCNVYSRLQHVQLQHRSLNNEGNMKQADKTEQGICFLGASCTERLLSNMMRATAMTAKCDDCFAPPWSMLFSSCLRAHHCWLRYTGDYEGLGNYNRS